MTTGAALKTFFFHLMPYPHLPADYTGSAWITCPNGLYDPARGADLYDRYLGELLLAEELGFHGVVINEHHSTAYGSMPSPNLVGAILARMTRRIKIAIVGNALPLYNPPTRVAEEWAMIDVLSRGRLIAGMVVGGGPEYFSSSMNPAECRDRFREAHDLIVKAWTEAGPTEFYGKFNRQRYLNAWPTPFQKPHPPIWIPGLGSPETMDFVASRRYTYMVLPYFHKRVVRKNMDAFRSACERAGYSASPDQMGCVVPIYVAETDAQARADFEEHFWFFTKRLLHGINAQPPGYISEMAAKGFVKNFGGFVTNQRSWSDVIDGGYCVVGSPETVRMKLEDELDHLRAGNLLGMFQVGTLPEDKTRRSLSLFAREVMPRLAKLNIGND